MFGDENQNRNGPLLPTRSGSKQQHVFSHWLLRSREKGETPDVLITRPALLEEREVVILFLVVDDFEVGIFDNLAVLLR